MRISTAQTFDIGIDNLSRRQTDLGQAQERLSSLKRVNRASDDPAAAARAERALAGIGRSEASQRAVDASRTAMVQTESAIAQGAELLQQAREAVVAAGNASYSDAERKVVAQQLSYIRQQLFAVANRSDGAGSFLFGGQAANQPPFIDAMGGVQFSAVPGQSLTGADTAMPLSADGQAVWLSARSGNGVFETRAAAPGGRSHVDSGQVVDPAALTGSSYRIVFSASAGVTTYAILKDGAATAVSAAPYTAGQAIGIDGMAVHVSGSPADAEAFDIVPSSPTLSAFDVLDRAIAQLGVGGRTTAEVTQSVSFGLRDLDAVLGNVQSARSLAGQALNRADNETTRLADRKLASQAERSDAQDLDLAKAISDFQTQQTGYDAALKSYAMVQRMSLFNYLNG
ncbi:MAG: flagellar hook-associated protein FlgL [Caldimonas sp.]